MPLNNPEINNDTGNPIAVASPTLAQDATMTNGSQSVQRSANTKASYAAARAALVPAALATDIFTLSGSATKTIKITRITIVGTQTTGGNANIFLIKRNAANTGGTSTVTPAVPLDSNFAAATGVATAYTANPTALGAAAGTIKVERALFAAATAESVRLVLDFGDTLGAPIVLRGAAQLLAINLNGVTHAGGSIHISVEWTEE